MKLQFAEPGFCVKESLGRAQFLCPGKQPGGRFFKPRFGSSMPALGQAERSRCLRRRHNRRVPVADDRRAAETVRGLGQRGAGQRTNICRARGTQQPAGRTGTGPGGERLGRRRDLSDGSDFF